MAEKVQQRFQHGPVLSNKWRTIHGVLEGAPVPQHRRQVRIPVERLRTRSETGQCLVSRIPSCDVVASYLFRIELQL